MANEGIFAIEDEEDILELVKFTLAREGYAFTGSTTGENALKVGRQEFPVLILPDLMLRGIDGLEVTMTLKNDPKANTIPVGYVDS